MKAELFTLYSFSRALFTLIISCLVLSCSSSPIYYDVKGVNKFIEKSGAPVRVAILPFENLTNEPGWEEILRVSFYNHFSSKNYLDIELGVVDRAVKAIKESSKKELKDIPPSELAELLNADILIYGKLISYNRYFLGLYSQISITVQIEMVGGHSGDIIWSRTITRRSHEGGIPFSLFGIIPSAIRSGYHMKKERTVELIEKINRELVASMPDAPPVEQNTPHWFKIQVASFMDESLAKKTRDKLKSSGLAPSIESAFVGGMIWHRVILGPFKDMTEANRIKTKVEQISSYQPIIIKTLKKQTR